MTETAGDSEASWRRSRSALRDECLALTALTVLLLVAWYRLVKGGTIIGQDAATQFYPWYSYLGERLRHLELPLWNPAQFAGAPFAADPQSGWTYLPAMLVFAAFPLAIAANLYLLVHLALAGFGAYAFARALAISPIGALAAGVAYSLSGLVYGRSVCCPAPLQVAAWTPLLLLGAERSLHRKAPRSRAASWVLAGLALSQILASWLGQVSYYALLMLGAYLTYRALIDPPDAPASWSKRLVALVTSGGAIAATGFGLAAAGMLPRLDYNRLTNVAGGIYGGAHAYAAALGGWSPDQTPLGDLTRSLYYHGGAVAALAVMSIVLTRRHATGFFAGVVVVALVLALDRMTPLHWILYHVFPRFEDLHKHWPERIAIVTFLAPATLAGACVSHLATQARHVRRLIVAALLPLTMLGVAVVALHLDATASWIAVGAAILAACCVIARAAWPRSWMATVIPILAVSVVAGDLLLAGPRILASGPYGGFHRADLTHYFAPSGAVRFLQERLQASPFRYFGYDPEIRSTIHDLPVLYRNQFASQEAAHLIVNNRATAFGLEDVQGYNPVQYQPFVDYLTALNGTAQDYHDANIFPAGLDSPLLDLLNVRYIVIPAHIPPDRTDLMRLATTLPVVYRDQSVQIVENREALPRAWMVHDVLQRPAGEALSLLASGTIDARQTAIVESALPVAIQPALTPDTVIITKWRPEEIRLSVTASTPGLLVLSQIAVPGWVATVDGQETSILQTNYLFQGIPVPAGSHSVTLRYHAPWLTAGLLITAGTIACIAVLWGIPSLVRLMKPAREHHARLRPVVNSLAAAQSQRHRPGSQ